MCCTSTLRRCGGCRVARDDDADGTFGEKVLRDVLRSLDDERVAALAIRRVSGIGDVQ